MNLNGKFLIISTLVVAILMQLLMWADFVSNKDTPLLVLMFIESILVVLLIMYVIKNKKRCR
ncbi:hypothetical protein QOZ83_13395 [Romboutsia sedimentorum]|uniref:hypothetical protein n=1 Tax=Romboutsia sedimentorum TaxID=1368474 RepID=UPI0024DE3CAE|nr:hypothetical protein [Romboutsia sedimentorum]MDK2586854.1 hypothetical protein [Romboutsia sedimentorum]